MYRISVRTYRVHAELHGALDDPESPEEVDYIVGSCTIRQAPQFHFRSVSALTPSACIRGIDSLQRTSSE